MTIIVSLLFLLSVGVPALFAILGMVSRQGEPPGLADGRLVPCPGRPNCVSSEGAPAPRHRVEPLVLHEDAMTILEAEVRDMGGRIRARAEGYLAAEFSSRLFGFVDDLELRADEAQGVIHLRSASRVGYSDGGVNRKRVAALRARYEVRMESGP